MSLVNCHICQPNSFEAGFQEYSKLKKLNLCIIFHINPLCLQTCGILISQMAVTHCVSRAGHLATSDILMVEWTVKNSHKVIFQVFSHFAQVQIGEKGTMAAGGVSQLSLITLEGSCVAKTQQLPSSWLGVWEPARKAKMHFTPLQAYAWSLPVSFSFSLTPRSSLFLFHTCKQKHSKIAQNCTKSATFTPWLNYNLWFCSRPSSRIYSVMWFKIPTLQGTACGVGRMFRFLQINSVCLLFYCDTLNQSNVNKRS